jgi:diadenosine tetraphosphate (Ap4A) HIT family hydrolase
LSGCQLCAAAEVLLENELAYVRFDNRALAPGHVLVVPRRHAADFFELTPPEQGALLELLNKAHALVLEKYAPDGFNIGVNVGEAAGQSRMHVHVHLIPRYAGDLRDPAGGVRRVLEK